MVFSRAYDRRGKRVPFRLGGRRMEQSVMFECHFGVDANAEYVRGDAVPVGSNRANCGLLSGFGHSERGLQLRNGNGPVQGGSAGTSATGDFDGDVAGRYLGNGILCDV